MATGINNAGQVVGYVINAQESAHAFVYSGGTMMDLNNLLLPVRRETLPRLTASTMAARSSARGTIMPSC